VSSDPIRTGLAVSLARPGGNVTGLTTMDWGMYGKRIEILKQVVPNLSKAALLLSPGNGTYAPGSP
jgi:putative ABC transport system substrate-binding protein